MNGYRRFLRLLGRTERDRARETDDEIEAHLEMRTADLVAAGHDDEEARRIALERFGDLEEARRRIGSEASRRDRHLGWVDRVDGVRRDLIVAFRRMRKRPGHAALSVGIFGAGIGLTTVMFTFVDHVLLRPLPFPEPDRLVALYSVPEEGEPFAWVSMGNWYDWRDGSRTLEATAIHSQEPFDVTVSGFEEAFTVPGVTVYGPLLRTLGVPLVAGAHPSAAEIAAEDALVAVSESFWRQTLAEAPLDGRTVTLDGRPNRVVAVVRDGFAHPEGVDVWLFRPPRPQGGAARNNINFRAVGRLTPETTLAQAEADLSSIADGIRATDPEAIYSWGVAVRPLGGALVADARGYLGVLMGAVTLVLLIGCANLAALGFARGTERADELALRLSLGARRPRLVRQLLTEEILLAALGGVVGVVLSWWGTGALVDVVSHIVPRSRGVAFDGRIAAFAAFVSLGAGVGAGLPPALRAARFGAGRAQASARTVRGTGGLVGGGLVAAEVALTVLLLTGGGLLLMSFGAVVSRDLGYDPAGVATVQVALTAPEYRDDDERVLDYWRSLRRSLESRPGVEAFGLGIWVPTGGGGTGFIDLGGDPSWDAGAGYRAVGGDYFAALRIPLVRGRLLGEGDGPGTELVTVVSRSMAEAAWPGQDPIGRRVRALSMESYWFGGEAPWRTVVGVVEDVRHFGYEDDEQFEEMYVPHEQIPGMARSMTAVVRLRDGRPARALSDLRRAAQSLDPALAVQVATLDDRLARLLAERRMIVTLLTTFAVAALLLASFGVYGVISYAVARRTREMAIRSALGARRSGVVTLVVRDAMRWVVLGGSIGLAVAVSIRGVLDSLLVEVKSGDPVAYGAAAACLALATLAAAAVPAVRASRLEPLRALREE